MKLLPLIMAMKLGALSLIGLGVMGCSTRLAQPQYLDYIADPKHGLTQIQEVNGTTLTCSYRPIDLLVSQDLHGRDMGATPAVIDSIRRIYAGKVYCTLSMARDKVEIENSFITDEAALGRALSYLSAGIAQDAYLHATAQPDSATALASTYTRQYGSTGRSTVLLTFTSPKAGIESGFIVTYRDTQFQFGTVRFVFPAQALQKLPSLEF